MKLFAHLRGLMLAAWILGFAPLRSDAQGTLQYRVTFDGPPPIPPTSEGPTSSYYERGMVFTPVGGVGRFGRSGGATRESFPRNGTAYVYAGYGYSLAVTSWSGQRFGVVSVDLAEWSTLYQVPLAVQFVGYRADGSSVTTEFVTDGIIDGSGPLADFETFYFDSRFANLVRLEVPTYGWSLDNMVFSQVPEPAAGALLVLGGLLLWALRRRSRARQ